MRKGYRNKKMESHDRITDTNNAKTILRQTFQ